jgi:hypothetical protein
MQFLTARLPRNGFVVVSANIFSTNFLQFEQLKKQASYWSKTVVFLVCQLKKKSQ